MSETTLPSLSKLEKKPDGPLDLSTGSAIAIVGVWFVGAAVTLTLFFAIFVFGDLIRFTNESDSDQGLGAIILLAVIIWLISTPMSIAHKVTKMILGKKD